MATYKRILAPTEEAFKLRCEQIHILLRKQPGYTSKQYYGNAQGYPEIKTVSGSFPIPAPKNPDFVEILAEHGIVFTEVDTSEIDQGSDPQP